jgi:hypothetical protein
VRQFQRDAARTGKTHQLGRKPLELSRDIAPRNAEIENDALNARERDQPADFGFVSSQKLNRVS